MGYPNWTRKSAPRLDGAWCPDVADLTTLSGNLTLEVSDATVLPIDPGGAGRTITLPAEADAKGRLFIIINRADGAEDLTVKNDGGTAVATVSQNEAAILICDGSVWRAVVLKVGAT